MRKGGAFVCSASNSGQPPAQKMCFVVQAISTGGLHGGLLEGRMEAMMLPYLTINQAVEKTQRSPSTIRRVIRSITDATAHVDRSGIEPTPKAVDAFKKKGENFTWTIREDVLLKHLPSAHSEEKKPSMDSSSTMKQDILQILQRELDLKNKHIEKQWEVIQSLNDRLREGNILMGSLQQRLALPHPESPAPVTMNASSMEPSVEVQRASKKKVMEVKQKLSKKVPVEASNHFTEPIMKSSRKGVLGWLFR